MRGKILSLIIVATLSFVVGFLYEFHYPKLQEWVKTQIYLQSYDRLPFLIKVDEVSLRPLTLSASLSDIHVSPKDELQKYISSISIESVDIDVSLFSLILGRFEIKNISIVQPKLAFISKPNQKEKRLSQMDFSFSDLTKIPVDSIEVVNGELFARLDEFEQSTQIKPFNLRLSKGFGSLIAELDLPQIKIKQKDIKDSLTSLSLYTKVSLSEKTFRLIDLRLSKDESFIVAKGETSGNPLKLEFKEPMLVSKWRFDLQPVKTWVNSYTKKITVPQMTGIFEGSLNLVSIEKDDPLQLSATVRGFSIEQYEIGNLDIQSTMTENIIHSNIHLQNQKQDILLKDAQLFLDKNYSFDVNLAVQSFELNQLLRNLNIGPSPLLLLTSGNSKCSGVILPSFFANCDGSFTVKDFHVVSKESKNKIVELQNLKASGKIHINTSFLSTQAQLGINNSTADAGARVDFKKGFRVTYETQNFSLSDVNLANLDLEGIARLNGHVEGNSDTANFQLSGSVNDAAIKGYFLGNLNTDVYYANSRLLFDNIKGDIMASDYAGNVGLNFEKDVIDINANSKNLNLAIMPKVLKDKLNLPFEIKGSGSAKIHVFGPLEANLLNYNMNANFKHLLVGKESIDGLKLETKTQDNRIYLSGSQITKARSKIDVGGYISKKGSLSISFQGDDIRLEESETIKTLTENLHSITDIDGLITGTLDNPKGEVTILLKKSSIGSASYQDGKIEFIGNKHSGISRFNVFNNQLAGSLQWDYDTRSPVVVEAVFNNWDFSPLFSLASAKNEREGYSANLNGRLLVNYDINDMLKSSMNLEIYKFLLSRGILDLRNKEVMQLNYKNHNLNLENFSLFGNNGARIQVTAPNVRSNDIKLSAEGNINLALISFFTPFLNDVRGMFTFQTSVALNKNKFEILGTARVNNAYAKLDELPVPFEKIEADYSFSQNRIAINRFRSEFGGGLVRGSGNIAINGVNDMPIRIEGVVENANIQISKGLELQTSGNLVLSGDWFPYKLQGDLNIRRGLISQEQVDTKNKLRKSYLLPESLQKVTEVPLTLDLRANLIGTNIKVVNDFVNTSIAGNLHISGNPTNPTLNGTLVQAARGHIEFSENEFEIETMNVNFNEDQNMNPSLYVLATTRVKEYDVTMTVGGSLKDIRPSFSSQPPLNEADIITLLTLGYTQDTLATDSTDPNNNSNALGLGAAALNRIPLNKQIEDKTGISVRFNTAADAADENITVPKVEVSKKWNSKLETKAGRTFGKTLKNDAKVQYKINDKVSVIGSWEAQSSTENSEFDTTNEQDVFGLDLEYRIEFK